MNARGWSALTLLAAGAALAGLAPAWRAADDAAGALRRAEALAHRTEPAAAAEYRKAWTMYYLRLRRDPADAEAWSGRGFARSALGDFAGAIRDLDRAIRLDGRDAQLYLRRAQAKRKSNDPAGAVRDCSEALRLRPEDPSALMGRAQGRLALGDRAGALADFRAAVRLHTKTIAEKAGDMAYMQRGWARVNLGDLRGAAADMDRALALNPRNANALRGRAEARLFSGDAAGAEADCRSALLLDPHDIRDSWNCLGRVHNVRGRFREAVLDFTQTLRRQEDDEDARRGRAYALYRLGRAEEAWSDADRAAALNPADHFAYLVRALAALRLGRLAQGRADAERASGLLRLQGEAGKAAAAGELAELIRRRADTPGEAGVRLLAPAGSAHGSLEEGLAGLERLLVDIHE